ncbi:MAG: hypothetical protein ACYCZ0_00135 [Minisyncoccota bacterium]
MKIKIIADGSSLGTRVVDESGHDIAGVTTVRFSHTAQSSPRLEIDLYAAEVEVGGSAKVLVMGREVRRIIYADGGEEEF